MADPTPEVVSIDGEEFYQWKVVLRIPKNWTPESGVFIAVAPPGGIANFPAAVQGSPGLPISIRNSTVVPLTPGDGVPDTLTWTLITPGTATTQPVYDVTLAIHTGAKGDDGILTILDADDLEGTPTAGYILRVNGTADGVEMVAMRVGNTYWPTSVAVLSNATGANALAAVPILSRPFPQRLRCNGQVQIHPDGSDVQVDLLARLGGTGTGDGSTDGLVIARGLGLANGIDQILAFAAAPPVNSTAGFGQLAASTSATVYIRAEVQGGSSTFDTIAGRALFSIDAEPVG